MTKQSVAVKKAELDQLRPRAPNGLSNLEHSQDLELTYTSNAIEGNALTAIETRLVIEHGTTVAGKPLRDHLEAIDHFEAIKYIRDLARCATKLTEMDIRGLHRLVMPQSNPNIAGSDTDQGRFVLTEAGRHALPSPADLSRRTGALPMEPLWPHRLQPSPQR